MQAPLDESLTPQQKSRETFLSPIYVGCCFFMFFLSFTFPYLHWIGAELLELIGVSLLSAHLIARSLWGKPIAYRYIIVPATVLAIILYFFYVHNFKMKAYIRAAVLFLIGIVVEAIIFSRRRRRDRV